MYFLCLSSSTVRCRRAGKYDAKADHILELRSAFERRESVPEVDELLQTKLYTRYGTRSGQVKGIAQRKRNVDRASAIDSEWRRTAKVCSRR